MASCQNGVTKHHSRAGIGHHLTNAFTLRFAETVYCTIFAGRLVLTMRTFRNARDGVLQQALALIANVFTPVMVAAIYPYHRFYGCHLAPEPTWLFFVIVGHMGYMGSLALAFLVQLY